MSCEGTDGEVARLGSKGANKQQKRSSLLIRRHIGADVSD